MSNFLGSLYIIVAVKLITICKQFNDDVRLCIAADIEVLRKKYFKFHVLSYAWILLWDLFFVEGKV